MKKILTIAIGLSFATVAVHAQNLAAYQSTVTGQSPSYYNTLDSSTALAPTVGTGTFTGTGTSFTADYFGNANDAVSFSGSPNSDALNSPGSPNDILANNTVGSLSLLFYMPTGTPGTQYIFSDGEATTAVGTEPAGTAFALDFSSGAFQLKAGNTSVALTSLGVPAANTWYYFAATWNTTVASGSTALNVYLGAAGSGTLATGTVGKSSGGTLGHINSTAVMGDGLGFVLGNRQTQGSGQTAAFNIGGTSPGADDELGIWNGSVLSSGQITSQFDALIVSTPEPSSSAFLILGLCGVLFLRFRKSSGVTAVKP
jgi:hypothetical protein